MHRLLPSAAAAAALVAALGLAGSACREAPPDDDASDDDTAPGDDDSAPGDDDATGDDYRHALTVTDPLEGDLSCIATPQDPGQVLHSDETAEVQARVVDFEDDTYVVGAYARVWGDNDVTGEPDFESTTATSTDGLVTVPAGIVHACTPYAYQVYTEFNPPETQPTYELGVILPPNGGAPWSGGDADFTSVSYQTYQIIPLVLSIQPTPGKGIAAGTFEDCNGEPVANAQILVRDASGNLAEDVYIRYFVDELPDRDQPWTSEDGLFGAIDVPVGTWTIEIWGVPNDTFTCPTELQDGRCKVREVPIFVTADSVNIANAPMKAYPEACFTE